MIDTDARFPTYQVVDGFAGPGGWSLACARLGLREIGIETDKAAHLTRRRAGFHTIRASVADLGPANFPGAVGKIDSPPCQTFSVAGKGAGRKALETVLTAVEGMARGLRYPLTEWEDPRTGLVLEPLRWHLDAYRQDRPYRWIALEQVPTVLPVWHAYAEVLESLGYAVAAGNLHAEQYGVPQTRKRAILIASLDREVSLPTPTHSRYHTRSPQRLDPGVLPWVTMAEALGWGIEGRPSPTITGGGTETGGAEPIAHLSRYPMALRSNYSAGGDGPAAERGRTEREMSEPSTTMTGKGAQWVHGRPATTVVGSFGPETIAAPGYRVSEADGSRQNAPGSVRVSVQEAGILQSFPRGFPWQGSKTQQYQQVGNAIPPLLAEAVLRAVL